MKINTTTVPAGAHQHRSPAKIARQLLESDSSLQAKPFGQIVSQVARGELAPFAATTNTAVPPPDGSSNEGTSAEAPSGSPTEAVDVTV
jgi:hypothetical protein